jgi:hypothetical protein
MLGKQGLNISLGWLEQSGGNTLAGSRRFQAGKQTLLHRKTGSQRQVEFVME